MSKTKMQGIHRKLMVIMAVIFAALMLICVPHTAHAKKYYSAKQVGLTGKNDIMQGRLYSIISVKGKKVRYCKVSFSSKGGDDLGLTFGKTKTAKLTSKTKYYIGEPSRFWQLGGNTGDRAKYSRIKWIRKVNKKSFVSSLGRRQWWDHIIVKNGKVQKIFTNMQIAS